MSPGRCALPSGMFSTRPIAPIALTLALRPASACISPTTQAAPAMSPFMSSMLAAGLIEMPPVSKHTPLPMKASGGVPFLPPFQRMIDDAALLREPCPTPSSAPMPSLRIALHVEDLDPDAELAQLRGAARELDRIENVGRLVDEVARQHDAFEHRLLRAPRLARGRNIRDAERHARLARAFVALLALGLVAVERVGAHAGAERQIGGGVSLHGAVAEFQHHGGLGRGRRNAPHARCRRA